MTDEENTEYDPEITVALDIITEGSASLQYVGFGVPGRNTVLISTHPDEDDNIVIDVKADGEVSVEGLDDLATWLEFVHDYITLPEFVQAWADRVAELEAEAKESEDSGFDDWVSADDEYDL